MAQALDMMETSAALQPPAHAPLPLEQRRDVTNDELERLALPYPAELYNGKVVYKMANPEHGLIQGNVIGALKAFLRAHPVGYVLSETNFRLWPNRERESRIPDVAFIKKDRLHQNLRRFPEMAPDLAIEIVSSDDNFNKVLGKVDAYLEQGVHIVWLIIPETREVLVCTAHNKHSVREKLAAPELLPGFELVVDEIFADLPRPERD